MRIVIKFLLYMSAAVLNWLKNRWPFVADKDFVCFLTFDNVSCPVLKMDVKTALSDSYFIELYILSEVKFSQEMVSKGKTLKVQLMPDALEKCFVGRLIAFSLEGVSSNFKNSNTSVMQYTERSIYKVLLASDVWFSMYEKRIKIFHDCKKADLLKEILKPYDIKAEDLNIKYDETDYEVITQYNETDYQFALRLLEEQNCFFNYAMSENFTSKPNFMIVNAATVGFGIVRDLDCFSFPELSSTRPIHDDFNFDQLIDLSKSEFVYASGASSEEVVCSQAFSSECTSYKLFAGDYFIIGKSFKEYYFVEKSHLSLEYREDVGWYIRNTLHGVILSNEQGYVLKRRTSSPKVEGMKQGYICGVDEKSVYVNSEGKVRVRILWDDKPYGYKSEQTEYVKMVGDHKDQINDFLGVNNDFKKEYDSALDAIDKESSKETSAVFDFAKDESDKKVVDGLEDQVLTKGEDLEAGDCSTEVWSINNEDIDGLTGWIPLMQWGWAGNSSGSYCFPRVGTSVMVSFVGGNPDSPMVIGSFFSLESQYPFAVMEESDKEESTVNFLKKTGEKAVDEVEDRLQAPIPQSIQEVENIAADIIEGVQVPYLPPSEKKSISSSAGNLVMRFFSYDDDKKTNEEAWNEITFFNDYAKSAIRMSSSFYILISSEEMISVVAPKLLKETLGKRFSLVSDTNYSYIMGESREIYGDNRITFFNEVFADSDWNGPAAERLKIDVITPALGVIAEHVGKQIDGTIMMNGAHVFVGYLGDYVAILYKGLFEFTSLSGYFNVNVDTMVFTMTGNWISTCFGDVTFLNKGKYTTTSKGLMAFSSGGNFSINTAKDCTIRTANDFYIKTLLLTGIMSQTALFVIDKEFGIDCGYLRVKSSGNIDLLSSNDLFMRGKDGITLSSPQSIYMNGSDVVLFASRSIKLVCENLTVSCHKSASLKAVHGIALVTLDQVSIKGSLINLTASPEEAIADLDSVVSDLHERNAFMDTGIEKMYDSMNMDTTKQQMQHVIDTKTKKK